ncbi:MAG: tetracycline efflux MFS transporter TetA(P) [Anaerolineales bacterium]
MKKLNATKVYLFIEMAASTFFPMIFVASSLYQVTVAGLTPLQLVLVGTALEISAFVFEVPTGVVADVYSRRLSIIIGYVLMGAGFLVEGFFPAFLPILLAQVLWGLGYTFTSGATQAWISDEIGEESANKLFLRATRIGLWASLIGMSLAVPIGGENTALPIRVGGAGIVLTGLALIPFMPETGFRPAPREDRNDWQQMTHTFKEGLAAVRTRPHLMTVLGIGLFYGLYSEGFDRLWVKHLLENFNLPVWFGTNEIAFFAVLRTLGTLLTIFVVQRVEKRLDTSQPIAIGRTMLVVTGLISAALIGFALSPVFGITLGVFLLIYVLRRVAMPLYTAWVNQKLDSGTRATVLSMSSQVDAIGQIAGGPGVGLIAKLASVTAAIVTSGLLLTPVLFLVRQANARSREQARGASEAEN